MFVSTGNRVAFDSFTYLSLQLRRPDREACPSKIQETSSGQNTSTASSNLPLQTIYIYYVVMHRNSRQDLMLNLNDQKIKQLWEIRMKISSDGIPTPVLRLPYSGSVLRLQHDKCFVINFAQLELDLLNRVRTPVSKSTFKY